MDTKRACQILNINVPFQEHELKKAWRTAALKHHPDKSRDPESERHFLEAQEAYTFLCMYGNENDESLLRHLLQVMSESVFGDSGRQLILDIFRRLDRNKAVEIFDYIECYATLLHVDNGLISELRNIIDTNSEVIIIRPTIQNLLQSEIYCLEHDGDTYYIPMWHHEVTYNRLIVRCLPELPPHMLIDEKGTIHVTVKSTASRVFDAEGITLMIGDDEYVIPGEKLRFIKHQTHVFKEKGIPQINQVDAFDNTKRGNIVVHLELIKY